jgi:hypothetical protein
MTHFEAGRDVAVFSADRQDMIPDLVLALASFAVLMSPVVVDAGKYFELRRKTKAEDDCWEKELPS